MTTPACASTALNASSIGLTLMGASITSLAPCCRPSEGHCEDILQAAAFATHQSVGAVRRYQRLLWNVISAKVRTTKPARLVGGRYEPLRCHSHNAFSRRMPDRRCNSSHQWAARTARAKTHGVA